MLIKASKGLFYLMAITFSHYVLSNEAPEPTDFEKHYQTYLADKTPFGIGVRDCGWTAPGGFGENIKLVDVEMAWNTFHEAFPPLFFTYGTLLDNFFARSHGTGALGLVAAKNDGKYARGIIGLFKGKGAQIGYASVCPSKDCSPDVAMAIQKAREAVGKGGVIMIEYSMMGPKIWDEAKCPCGGQCNYLPVEYDQPVYDAIKEAIDKGVTVVEAAANGVVDLDNPIYENKFNRNRDSGAIIVAAADAPGQPLCFTNWGSRVDVHGPGTFVGSLGGFGLYSNGGCKECENHYYSFTFGGTSSATAIVAGVAGLVQSVAIAKLGKPLGPRQLRELLVKTGTPQQNGDKHIGPLPNLCKLIPELKSLQGAHVER